MDHVKHIGMDVHKEAIFARSTCAYLLEKTNSYALRSRNIARVPQTFFFGSTAGFPLRVHGFSSRDYVIWGFTNQGLPLTPWLAPKARSDCHLDL
jgi:hypothetical protein